MDLKTLYMCWIEDSFKNKGPENNLFISIEFFIVFLGYTLRILGFFKTRRKKNKISLNSRLNRSKDTLYV
jgi:hypothetical protein